MQLLHAPAILLDVVDLHEKDRIVTFLTAEHGKKRGVAKSSRTKFSRFAGQLQPLCTAQVSWSQKEGRDLVRLSEVQLVRPVDGLQKDLEGILICAYLAEHMTEFALEDDPSGPLYRLLDTTLEALLAGIDRTLATRYYEIWVLRLAGVLPVPRECPLCGELLGGPSADGVGAALVESEAAIVCRSCAEGHGATEVSGGMLEFLRRSGRQNLPTLAEDPPPPSILGESEVLARKVRRHFLQNELRSYRVMRDTLS